MAGVLGRGRFVRRNVLVLEKELHLATCAQFHGAAGKPAAAFLGISEVLPDPFDGAGERAHNADLAGSGKLGGLVIGFHDFLFFWLRSSSAFSSRSKASSRWLQKFRVRSSH